ncbi:TraB/GumN family protein [Yoonia sp. GPGPB17]|uniref:TraB/GumN family protein n=1 Tax=Yoonia sp. GPGPB17 TaxID=3026147 RepID=UPI0030BCB8F7
MFLRSAASVLFTLTALPVAAACVGESYLDRMTPDQHAELSAAVAHMPYAEGLTWTATKEDASITVVGTMHIYDPRLEELRAELVDTVASADLVMLEATPEEEAALQNLITTDPSRLFIVDGPTLPELVDEETWQLISAAASERGIPSFMAAKMQPWYLSLTLAVPSCAMSDMMAGARGLDHMIIQEAEAAGVPMQAVEPYTTLFDLFEDDSFDEQIDMLRVNMLVPDLQEQMFVAMLDRYFAEDIGRLWEMSRIALSDVPDLDPAEATAMFDEMEESLLNTRNRNWIPVIAEASETHDDIVVAVGAGHLIGESGVLQLLENEGWAITRID